MRTFKELPISKGKDRVADVARTVAEIRAKYISDNVKSDTCFKLSALHYANASDMSSDAFRKYFTDITYADPDGGNTFQSNDVSAKLTGMNLRAIERANNELKTGGWRSITQRRKKKSWVARCKIPQKAMDAILFELLEPPPVADQGSLEPANLADQTVLEPPPVADQALVQDSRTATRGGLPFVKGDEEEERETHRAREGCNDFSMQTEGEGRGLQMEPAASLEAFFDEDDFQNFHEGMNAWIASDPKNLTPTKQSRSFTDRHLRSLWRSWTTLHAPEIALAAFRSVNYKASVTTAKYAPTFSGYCNFIASCMEGKDGKQGALEKITISQGKARTAVVVDQEIGREKVNREKLITEKSGAAFDRSAEMNLAAKPKQIANGGSQNDRYIERDGGTYFNPKIKLVTAFGVDLVLGFHTDKLVQEMRAKGATIEDFEEAFGKETGKNGDRTREDVLKSVRRHVEGILEKRRDQELKDKYGEPESLCNGTPHPNFKTTWVCLSQEFVAGLIAKFPSIVTAENGSYRGGYMGYLGTDTLAEAMAKRFFLEYVQRSDFSDGFPRSVYFSEGYGVTLQKQVEDHVTAKMLKEHDENIEQAKKEVDALRERERRKAGVWVDDGELKISPIFENEINRKIGSRPASDRLWEVVDSLRGNLAEFGPKIVADRLKNIVFSARNMTAAAMRESLLREVSV